ncbi:MAG: LacI family DNA-binding transcriptional regulator [Thermodesulfobacteriota bacterium]
MTSKNSLTIRDIARMAKVSHTTVSRVLNNDPRVQEKTKKRILDLVNKLGFKPDARARNLALKKSNLIGLVVTDIRNPFYGDLARGIEDKAHQLGYNVIFCSTDHKADRMESYVNLMLDVGVDGFVFASSRLHEPAIENLIEKRFPLVLVNRKLKSENYSYVVLDNFKGAYDITKHLIDSGYRRIAIIDGPSNVFTGLERLKGYQRALKDHDIDVRPDYIFQGNFARATGYEGASRLLMMKDRPEAIFSGSDYIAMGVFDAIEELGLKIPEDLALVGFDDTEFASNQRIRLTTVSQREYTMGGLGVQILIDYIENKEMGYVHKVVLESKLVIRESCGCKLRRNGARAAAASG